VTDKNLQTLISTYERKIHKALEHLEYSHKKIQNLASTPLDEEGLETWESYTSRFSGVVDIFLTKYLKARVLAEDPAFDGTLRDFCNVGEKMGLIDSAESWLAFRELRNATAHEYEESDLSGFFERIRKETPKVLQLRKHLHGI